jgi:hypothetical protein
MSKLLIQDDIINGMDVYVEYTFDTDESIVLYDYGIELTNIVDDKLIHASLRGFKETVWMVEKLEEYITAEHTVECYL